MEAVAGLRTRSEGFWKSWKGIWNAGSWRRGKGVARAASLEARGSLSGIGMITWFVRWAWLSRVRAGTGERARDIPDRKVRARNGEMTN